MHFDLIDAVTERSDTRIVALKQVSIAEEYLRDHFPDFPVLPGVFMIETMVQAARRLVTHRPEGPGLPRMVMGEVKALRFGSFVKPGESLRVEVEMIGSGPDSTGTYKFKGSGTVIRPGQPQSSDESAVSGRFTLRPVRVGHGI